MAALALLAFSTRILPYMFSSLPYNQDGLTECRIAGDIQAFGDLKYADDSYYSSTHGVVTPLYNLLLAFVASVLGSIPLDIAQIVVAMLAMITVVGVYRIALRITKVFKEAFAAGLFVGLLGTFVFLTGSTWKASLGVSMLVLLFYAYMNRMYRRMFAIEVIVLAMLPFVHHLVLVIGYFSIAFLTIWSVYFATMHGSLRKRNVVDVAVLFVLSLAAYFYYSAVSLDRLEYIRSATGLMSVVVVFLALVGVMLLVLTRKSHSKFSFAPIPALAVFVLFAIDYFYPIFPYNPGSPRFVLILVASLAVLVGFAWLGLEDLIESRSRYRALPLCMLLPVVALFGFSLSSGLGLSAHQVMYRSFDFADIALALGMSVGLLHFRKRPRAQAIAIFVVVVVLLVSFPFSYGTGTLLGIRHDTQSYEVDALEWADDSAGAGMMLQSDERLSYVATALYGFERMPYLPTRFFELGVFGTGALYVIEDDWATVGVNDYPRGHRVLNETKVEMVLMASDVLYIGGPQTNRILVFVSSIQGQDTVFGYH
jgi:hypothetical protein